MDADTLLYQLEKANREIGRLEERITSMPAPEPPRTDLRMNPATFEQFIRYVKNDQFIDAIRLVRGAFGLGLKEAKDLVILVFPNHQR